MLKSTCISGDIIEKIRSGKTKCFYSLIFVKLLKNFIYSFKLYQNNLDVGDSCRMKLKIYMYHVQYHSSQKYLGIVK